MTAYVHERWVLVRDARGVLWVVPKCSANHGVVLAEGTRAEMLEARVQHGVDAFRARRKPVEEEP